MSQRKPLDQELAETFRTIRSLRARSPDELEDYFHDSLVSTLGKGRPLSTWMGYIYKSVQQRLRFGREAEPYVPLEESIFPAVEGVGIDNKLDIKRALATLTPRRQAYIHEYFYEGYTLEEMAERHQLSIKGVQKVLVKGLRDLRTILVVNHANDNQNTNPPD